MFSCTKPGDSDLVLDASASKATGPGAQRPNIVIIVIDDVGYEVPQYSGGQSYTTPNMNQIAATGMQFTHCYAAAMCSPSRVALLTGKYGFRNYVNWGIMDTAQKTMANMLKDNGYKTCAIGKWQLDGGAVAMEKFGFDSHSVFDPFEERDWPDEEENKYRYKNPRIYQNGAYLPDAATRGKYSDDEFTAYAINFIKENKQNPFFVYFSFSECHKPFSPPPSHPDFAAWNPLSDAQNKKYFPSMVSYMDSKLGELFNAVAAEGLQSKTYFFIFGDNGTPPDINSRYNGRVIRGGKQSTHEFGVHVPMLVAGPLIRAGSVCRDVVDFTDFMPTIAALTKVPPTRLPRYGILDGLSFHRQLFGVTTPHRTSAYTYYNPNVRVPSSKRVYVNDTTYKLYDSTNNNNFYNMQVDSLEQFPLPESQLTAAEKKIRNNFRDILARMHN